MLTISDLPVSDVLTCILSVCLRFRRAPSGRTPAANRLCEEDSMDFNVKLTGIFARVGLVRERVSYSDPAES